MSIRELLFISFVLIVSSFHNIRPVCRRRSECIGVLGSSLQEHNKVDLTGYKLWSTFNGFGVQNMTNGIELKADFQADFAKGIKANGLGFWRIIGYDDGKVILEATQPILPEYMFFFDIWEKNIYWRGTVDLKTMRVTEGTVITNKKVLGIFPYTETLATFEADLIAPGGSFPDVKFPSFKDQRWEPPADFETPYDMRRYPEVFDPEFVDWWFANEEALASGGPPLPRPKAFFVPAKTAQVDASENSDNELERVRQRSKRGATSGFASSESKKK